MHSSHLSLTYFLSTTVGFLFSVIPFMNLKAHLAIYVLDGFENEFINREFCASSLKYIFLSQALTRTVYHP